MAFNTITIEWMVIGRLRLNTQDANAYSLAFNKIFSRSNSNFKLGDTLIAIVTDWSDSEINGLKKAIGNDVAEKLLKGCTVHWLRSCKRIAERIATSADRPRERSVFLSIAAAIQKLKSEVDIIACFQPLCGVRKVEELVSKVPAVISLEDATFVDEMCD